MLISLLILLNTLFKVVSGGSIYLAEYVVVEANCTDDPCVPLNDAMAVSKQIIELWLLRHLSKQLEINTIQLKILFFPPGTWFLYRQRF